MLIARPVARNYEKLECSRYVCERQFAIFIHRCKLTWRIKIIIVNLENERWNNADNEGEVTQHSVITLIQRITEL